MVSRIHADFDAKPVFGINSISLIVQITNNYIVISCFEA